MPKIEVGQIEDWGRWKLRPTHAKIFKDAFPIEPKSRMSDLRIKTPWRGIVSTYNPKSGATELRSCDENGSITAINHEFIHYLLHKFFGIRCCFQFDNIGKIINDRLYCS